VAEKGISNIAGIVLISLVFLAVFITEVYKPRMESSLVIGTVTATTTYTSVGPGSNVCPSTPAEQKALDDCNEKKKLNPAYSFDYSKCECSCAPAKSDGSRVTSLSDKVENCQAEHGSWSEASCECTPQQGCCMESIATKLAVPGVPVTFNQCGATFLPGKVPKTAEQWASAPLQG